jgi:hypothetical protein
MEQDTKGLLKSATSNAVTILGYISIGSAIPPTMAFIRSYLCALGAFLVIIGIFRGALTVLKTVTSSKDAEIKALRFDKDMEIATRDKRITELKIEKEYLTIDEHTRDGLRAIAEERFRRRDHEAGSDEVMEAVMRMHTHNPKLWRVRCPSCRKLFRVFSRSDERYRAEGYEREAGHKRDDLASECPAHDSADVIDEYSKYAI